MGENEREIERERGGGGDRETERWGAKQAKGQGTTFENWAF